LRQALLRCLPPFFIVSMPMGKKGYVEAALLAAALAACAGRVPDSAATGGARLGDATTQRDPGIAGEVPQLVLAPRNSLAPLWLEWRLAEAGLRDFTLAAFGQWEDVDELQIAPGEALLIGPRGVGPTQEEASAQLKHAALSIDGTAVALDNYPALAGGKRYFSGQEQAIAGAREGYVAFVGVVAPELALGTHSVVVRERFAAPKGPQTLTRRIRLIVSPYRDQSYLKQRGNPPPLPRIEGRLRAPADSLVITHARLFDGAQDAPRDDQTLVVEGGRIRAIHPSTEIELPKRARVVDASGATVLPGLIDAHLHTPARDDPYKSWLAQGVTTLVEVSGDTFTMLTLRDRWLRSEQPRPRLLTSGSMILIPDGAIVRRYGTHGIYEVASTEEAREAVSALARHHVNLIKIALSPDPAGRSLSNQQICESTEVAHAHGLRVMAHVMIERDALRAARCGVDILTHMPRLSDAAVERLRSAGVGVVPTLSIYGGSDYAYATSSLRRLFSAGLLVGCGNDYPNGLPPGLPLKELRGLLDAGLTPAQVLQAATRVNAELLGIDASLGTLEPGKIADLIVVDGDPLTDLSTLRNLRAVVANGEIVP
jgi:imidazolonepropionase-like amidohydrolase